MRLEQVGDGKRIKAALVSALVVGSVETWIVVGASSSFGGLIAVWIALCSLWLCVALLWMILDSIVSVAAFGVGSSTKFASSLIQKSRQSWYERSNTSDALRVGRLLGTLIALGLWVVASSFFVRHLLLHRHGVWLISLTAVIGMMALSLPVYLVGRSVGRFAKLLRLKTMSSPLSFPVMGIALAIVSTITVAWIWDRYAKTLQSIDALSFVLPLVLIFLCAVLPLLFSKPSRRAWWGLALLAPIVCVLALQHPTARVAGLRDAATSKYVLHRLMLWSNFDDDGSASFPSLLDCAPFNKSVHPGAREIVGNGVDENCDTLDESVSLFWRKHKDFVAPVGPKPNIVLVTLDATRADHMGFLGYPRVTTPNLDAFATEAVVFTKAFSQDSGTGPSFWSLFSGKTPFQVTLRDAGRFPPLIGPDEKMLAELLSAEGYKAHAVLCGYAFDSKRLGIRRGFKSFANVCGHRKMGIAKTVTEKAIAKLETIEEPFFIWVHYYDPHASYEKHDEYDFGDDPIDRYDSEIRYADEQIGRLLNMLKTREWQHPIDIAITADHGENFLEHGKAEHARTLYKNVTHVPLLIWGHGFTPRKVDAPVAVGDLYPTLLSLAQGKANNDSTMVNQVAVLHGLEPDEERVVFQENAYSRPRRNVKAAVSATHHYLMDLSTGVDEFYDYVDDPSEKKNLIGLGLPEETDLRRLLIEFISTTHLPPELSK